jgi:D-alanine-D-alanine ligase-like ATP-grasp enzyme
MCSDITKEQTDVSYTVVEINVNPGIAMHMLPGDNDPVNIATTLVKLMFPEIFV